MSFTSFIRRMRIARTIDVVNHIRPQYSGRRSVFSASSRGFYWTSPATWGATRAYLEYPTTQDIRIDGPDTITFLVEGEPYMTITLPEAS